MINKATKGAPILADDWNQIAEFVNNNSIFTSGATSSFTPIFLIKNDTTSDLEIYSNIRISGVENEITLSNIASNKVIFIGTQPQSDNTNFGILQEPIKAGKIGKFMVPGAFYAKVWGATSMNTASPATGNFHLEYAQGGILRILARYSTGTEPDYCLLKCENLNGHYSGIVITQFQGGSGVAQIGSGDSAMSVNATCIMLGSDDVIEVGKKVILSRNLLTFGWEVIQAEC